MRIRFQRLAAPLASKTKGTTQQPPHDVVAGQHAARGIDGPFHKRDPGQLFYQLVRYDGIFFNGRYDDAAFFHFLSL